MMETNAELEMERYIDLSSDVGFKIAFGDPDRPEPMLGLLNALIPGKEIVKIEFLDPEIRPEEIEDKRVRFDIRCIEPDGRSFVVEMQKGPYKFMVDRLIVYSGDPLKRLLKSGRKYSEINPLYIICIANYVFDFGDEPEEVRNQLLRSASLKMDDTNKTLSDKYNFLFLQLPLARELNDCQSFLEKVAYLIRNIHSMKERPKKLDDEPYFKILFEAAERRYISEANLKLYDNMIRDEIQIEAEKEYAIEQALKKAAEITRQEVAKGKAEGIAEGEAKGEAKEKLEAARSFKALGVDLNTISTALNIPIGDLEKL